jgi:FkbM family methyltransferase
MKSTLKQKLTVCFKILKRQEIWVRPQVKEFYKWYGDIHAGFYLCPKYLNESSVVYSFGVGCNVSFDLAIIKDFSCNIYAFDPTPKSIQYVKDLGEMPNFNFYPFGVYDEDGLIKFFLPANPEHVSGSVHDKKTSSESISVPVKKFSTIAKELGHSKIDLVKMDIEGSEYAIIDDMLSSGVIISQILIEVHHRFNGLGIQKTKELIRKLNNAGYFIAAVSPTNEEYTFVYKDESPNNK